MGQLQANQFSLLDSHEWRDGKALGSVKYVKRLRCICPLSFHFFAPFSHGQLAFLSLYAKHFGQKLLDFELSAQPNLHPEIDHGPALTGIDCGQYNKVINIICREKQI